MKIAWFFFHENKKDNKKRLMVCVVYTFTGQCKQNVNKKRQGKKVLSV